MPNRTITCSGTRIINPLMLRLERRERTVIRPFFKRVALCSNYHFWSTHMMILTSLACQLDLVGRGIHALNLIKLENHSEIHFGLSPVFLSQLKDYLHTAMEPLKSFRPLHSIDCHIIFRFYARRSDFSLQLTWYDELLTLAPIAFWVVKPKFFGRTAFARALSIGHHLLFSTGSPFRANWRRSSIWPFYCRAIQRTRFRFVRPFTSNRYSSLDRDLLPQLDQRALPLSTIKLLDKIKILSEDYTL